MLELITASFSYSNLIFTTLLLLTTVYWFSVIIGAIGMDAVDIDLDMDVDVDVDIDVDVDADIDVDAEADVEAANPGSGLMIGVLRFFNFGRVPFMVLMSIAIMVSWAVSVYCHHDGSWVNPTNSIGLAAALFVPISLVGLFSSKIITTPLIPFFANLDTAAKDLEIEGKIGTLLNNIEEDEIGQLRINIDDAMITLNVKANQGSKLKRGDRVVIVVEEGNLFIVEKMDKH